MNSVKMYVQWSCLILMTAVTNASFAQPSSEWKQSIDGFDHYVHEPSVNIRSLPKGGDKEVTLWTVRNIQQKVIEGKTIRSIKGEHRVRCSSRLYSNILYGYGDWYGTGEQVAGPSFEELRSIEPESMYDVIWRKYCKSWRRWFN